jgi:hypothetical protein
VISGRRAVRLVALAGWGAIASTAACQTGSSGGSCDLQQQVAQTGTALTLLPGARLDRVGNGFRLLGNDGHLVRWAPVTGAGEVGSEQSLQIPAEATAGPWFAAAGRSNPGDTTLVVYGVPASTAGSIDLRVIAMPTGGAASSPMPLMTVPDPASSAGAFVAITSGRAGMRAGLTWSDQTTGTVFAQALTGDGQPQADPVSLHGFGTSPLLSCLSFVDGKNELAVGFLSSASEDDPNPHWTVGEVTDTGGLAGTLVFALGTARPSCPFTAASGAGYVNVWQNELGSLIGVYDGKSQDFVSKLFAGAVTFGGADVQPPLAGVAPLASGDFAVVLARPGAAEAWRLVRDSLAVTDTLVMPSAVGQMGQISTVSASGALYATYADYSSAAAVGKEGERFFVKVSCF